MWGFIALLCNSPWFPVCCYVHVSLFMLYLFLVVRVVHYVIVMDGVIMPHIIIYYFPLATWECPLFGHFFDVCTYSHTELHASYCHWWGSQISDQNVLTNFSIAGIVSWLAQNRITITLSRWLCKKHFYYVHRTITMYARQGLVCSHIAWYIYA